MCSSCSFAIVPPIHPILPTLISDSSWNVEWSIDILFNPLLEVLPSSDSFMCGIQGLSGHQPHPTFLILISTTSVYVPSEKIKLEISDHSFNATQISHFCHCSLLLKDFPSAPQMKLQNTLKCNSGVTYCLAFLHFPRGKRFWILKSVILESFLILDDYFIFLLY